MAFYHEIGPETALSLMEEGTLCIDMRNQEDFMKARLPKAIHAVTPDEVAKRQGVKLEEPVIVYCNRGISCKKFADHLAQFHGFKEVYILEGGLKAWLSQYPGQIDSDNA